MSPIEEQFKINLNQNLWGLFLVLLSLGLAEKYGLKTLFWFSVLLSGVMTLSVTITITAYTCNYWVNKMRTK